MKIDCEKLLLILMYQERALIDAEYFNLPFLIFTLSDKKYMTTFVKFSRPLAKKSYDEPNCHLKSKLK